MNILTAIDGSDYMVILGKKLLGEIYKVKTNSIDRTIEVDVTMFNNIDQIDSKLKTLKDSQLVEIFVNEDSKFYRVFEGVKYIGQKSSHNCNSKYLTSTYILKYETESPYKSFNRYALELIKEFTEE